MDIRVLDFRQDLNAAGKPVDWVCYAGAHALNTTSTWARVNDLIPPETVRPNAGIKLVHMKAIWDKIGPKYEAWKQGEEIPADGTPIAAWPALSKEQVKALRSASVNTIEDLARASDAALGEIKLPQTRDLRRQAQAFLELRDNQDKASELAELRAEIERLKAGGETEEAPKPRRGRPPKAKAEEGEAA